MTEDSKSFDASRKTYSYTVPQDPLSDTKYIAGAKSVREIQEWVFDHSVDKTVEVLEALTRHYWMASPVRRDGTGRDMVVLTHGGDGREMTVMKIDTPEDEYLSGKDGRLVHTDELDGHEWITEELWPYDLGIETSLLDEHRRARRAEGLPEDPLAWTRLGASTMFDPVVKELMAFMRKLKDLGFNPANPMRSPEAVRGGADSPMGFYCVQGEARSTTRKILKALQEQAIANADKPLCKTSKSPFVQLVDTELDTAFCSTFGFDDAARAKVQLKTGLDILDDDYENTLRFFGLICDEDTVIKEFQGVIGRIKDLTKAKREEWIKEADPEARNSPYQMSYEPEDLIRLIRTLNGMRYYSPANGRYPSAYLDLVGENMRDAVMREHDLALESIVSLLCGVYVLTFNDLNEGVGSVGDSGLLWMTEDAYGLDLHWTEEDQLDLHRLAQGGRSYQLAMTGSERNQFLSPEDLDDADMFF